MKKWIGIFGFVLLMCLGVITNVFASKTLKYDDVISYVYIDLPEMTSDQTQRIGIVLDETITADTFELVYQSQTTGKSHTVPASKQLDGVVSFEWIPEEGIGDYQIIQLNYMDKNGSQSIVIEDANFAFSVKKEILDVVSVEPIPIETQLSSVAQKHIANKIAASLEETILQVEQPILLQNERTQNIVIALDAGHDSSHAGAQANGIIEELVTLKLAKYAKEELETYDGVSVYMTRTEASCPYPETIGTASANDIMKRIDAAVNVGAQAVISFHLNSYTSSSPKGCLVLCPQGSDSIAVDALELSDRILEKLCAVGFENDGTRQEKWTITSYAKQKGIPGIIIEHGFISNPEDAAKLNDEACVKAMGIADAQGIAEFYGLQKKSVQETMLHVGSGEYMIENAQDANLTLGLLTETSWMGSVIGIGQKSYTYMQDFVIKKQTSGYYQIQNKSSGMAIGIGQKNQDGTYSVSQNTWTGVDEQLWQFVSDGNGYCYIRSKSGLYLTRTGTSIVADGRQDPAAQNWKIAAFFNKSNECAFFKKKIHIGIVQSTDSVSEGIFSISPKTRQTAVAIAESSKDDGVNVELQFNKQTDASQHWSFMEMENQYYRIMNLKSGKALSIATDGDAAGTNVSQCTWNAMDSQLWRFIDAGSGNYYIMSKQGAYLGYVDENVCLVSERDRQKWVLTEKSYTILGDSTVTVSQMADYYNRIHKDNYPGEILATGGAATITEFCQILMEEAEAEHVRAEVAFAQVILETGWLRFTGSVQPEWFNFCGLGAIDTDAAGSAARFTDVREGLRAQIQHLKAYGSTETLENECVDPRFHLVKRGCSPYVQWLGEKDNPEGYGWSTSQGYGNQLMLLIEAMND